MTRSFRHTVPLQDGYLRRTNRALVQTQEIVIRC